MDRPADAATTQPLAQPAWFDAEAEALGIEFEPGDVVRLGRFLALMLDANKTTNLTAITEPADAWRKHILDALALVPMIATIDAERRERSARAASDAGEDSADPDRATNRVDAETDAETPLSVVDVGSGGGVPALPLAIVMPHVRFSLVESTGRKVEFLRRAIAALGLENVRVLNVRAEALGQDHREHRERYDVATARALGHLAIVTELLGPLVRPHGFVIAVKGAKADQELAESSRALGLIGLRHAQTVDSPTGRLVLLEKTTRTPRTYPRKDGEPARSPLKNLTGERGR